MQLFVRAILLTSLVVGPTVASFVHDPFTPIIVDCDKVVPGSGIRGNSRNNDNLCRETCLRRCGPSSTTRNDWKECLNKWHVGTCTFGGQVLAETIEGWVCNTPQTDVVLGFPFAPDTTANGTIDHYWFISRIAVRWQSEIPPYPHCVNSTQHARLIESGFPITEYAPRKWCTTSKSFMEQFEGGTGQYGPIWIDANEHWMAFTSSDYADLTFLRSQKSDFSIRVVVGSCGARVLGDPAKALLGLYLEVEEINWNDSDDTITHTVDPGVWDSTSTSTASLELI